MIVSYPIPGSFLVGSVADGYVTIASPGTKVIMLSRDAYALMHWLYEVLPAPLPAVWQGKIDDAAARRKDIDARMRDYSQLWIRRRLAA